MGRGRDTGHRGIDGRKGRGCVCDDVAVCAQKTVWCMVAWRLWLCALAHVCTWRPDVCVDVCVCGHPRSFDHYVICLENVRVHFFLPTKAAPGGRGEAQGGFPSSYHRPGTSEEDAGLYVGVEAGL